MVLFAGRAATGAAAAGGRFQIEVLADGPCRAYVLRDTATDASARIAPEAGNECVVLRLPGPDGRVYDLLPPLRANARPTSGSRQGIPILFPWPGRIPGGAYRFQGRTFQLPVTERRTRGAMHGFVEGRRWHVERAEADEQSARLTCRIGAADCPEGRAGYPFDWSLRVTHELTSAGLSVRAEVANGGKGPMPFGLGFHPWLRAPLGEGGRPGDCLVQVPATEMWDMGRIDAISPASPASPSGGSRSSGAGDSGSAAWKAVCPPELSLRRAVPLVERPTVLYTDLETAGGFSESRVIDPRAGVETVVRADANLPTMVVFRARGSRSVCLEPWSCPPNVFNLAGRIGKDSGLVVLEPGETWRTGVTFLLRGRSESRTGW